MSPVATFPRHFRPRTLQSWRTCRFCSIPVQSLPTLPLVALRHSGPVLHTTLSGQNLLQIKHHVLWARAREELQAAHPPQGRWQQATRRSGRNVLVTAGPGRLPPATRHRRHSHTKTCSASLICPRVAIDLSRPSPAGAIPTAIAFVLLLQLARHAFRSCTLPPRFPVIHGSWCMLADH
jgi:hypothetical protein